MVPNDGPPLSLWPFPVADKEPKNLAEFIARVNAQPGGFRALSEEKLLQEIKARTEDNGAAGQDDVPMADAGDDDDDDDAAAASKDPAVARLEVLRNIDVAGNTAMLTLDFLSLLLSKQNPTQAGLTLSQQLREIVGIGTLGADKLDEPTTNEAKARRQQDVAIGWTLLEINRTRDAAQAASSLLDKEVHTESRYWEDVMAVKTAGWSICRVPQERHTLGVRFGFSEASPEFKNNGLAPMRRRDDGSVELDLGRLGGVSEGLVVTYALHGNVVGRSVPRRRSRGDPSLQSRVLEARNTIFSQELWYELTREARTLAAYNVRISKSRLTCIINKTSKITVELLPLASCPPHDNALPDNDTAEAISASLHILLSYAHRYNELMRTRPVPPHISRSRGQQTYALLRPLIARITYNLSIESCTQYVGDLAKTLRAAGLSAAFTLHTPPPTAVQHGISGPNQSSDAQNLIRNMLQPLEFTIEFTVLPGTSLTIRGRTFLFPVTATYYHVFLPPSSPLQGSAAPYADGFPDLEALSGYLHTAVARSLSRHFLASFSDPTQWTQGIQGTSLRDLEAEKMELHFSVQPHNARPALVLASVLVADRKLHHRKWRWTPDAEPGTNIEPLEDVVARVVEGLSS